MKRDWLLNNLKPGKIFLSIGELFSQLAVVLLILKIFSISVYAGRGIEPEKVKLRKGPYYFDGKISRVVLENYLDRSVTMGYFLVPGTPERYEFPYRSDDISLLDFNSFPLRIKEIPERPYEAKLQVGYLDAIFKRSKGCISPSGWKCESLPYLVEFDNYGRGKTPNVADTTSIFVWGWDEISWFAQQSEEARNKWLVYAWDWIKKTDPDGHLQMPVTRMITCPNETLRSYFANTKNPSCPVGYSQEETIKKIWNQK